MSFSTDSTTVSPRDDEWITKHNPMLLLYYQQHMGVQDRDELLDFVVSLCMATTHHCRRAGMCSRGLPELVSSKQKVIELLTLDTFEVKTAGNLADVA